MLIVAPPSQDAAPYDARFLDGGDSYKGPLKTEDLLWVRERRSNKAKRCELEMLLLLPLLLLPFENPHCCC